MNKRTLREAPKVNDSKQDAVMPGSMDTGSVEFSTTISTSRSKKHLEE